MRKSKPVVKVGTIQQRILLIRGEKVIVDADLAEFYGVPTKALNQAVRRNMDRFPADFMFQLNKDEKMEVVTNCDHLKKLKYSPVNPLVFTEHGALMAASILNSARAVAVSLFIVRAFVALRRTISEHKELARKITQLERKLIDHDDQIIAIIQAINKLSGPQPVPKKRRIGFHSE
ncbi:MAG: ORF6N domain-containing protein [Deltaproteobacteria bacterium]|nr:ORF6N domain-containing protein [Deltaproteobacteria bacterium]